jgi:RHS repeat-associated protein
MDSQNNVNANNLLNSGLGPNLHPLLAPTSIFPGIPTALTPSSLYTPVDNLPIYYAPLSTSTANTQGSISVIQPAGSEVNLNNLFSLATPTQDTLLSPVKTYYAPLSSAITAPAQPLTITAQLAVDSGTSNSDLITNNQTISGNVIKTTTAKITLLKAGFDSTPTANWRNVTTSLKTDGSFNFTPSQLNQINGSNLPDGTHTLHLSATDSRGNQSNFDYTFILDTTIGTPSLQLTASSDTGTSNSDRITKTNTPTITGTGDIGATIKVNDGNTLVGQTTVGTDGKWQIATNQLTNGTHNLTATATDLAGNLSSKSAPLAITIDTVAPQIQLNSLSIVKVETKLAGVVNGTGSGVVGLTYQWDNQPPIAVNVSNEGEFEQPFNLTGLISGTHNLTLTGTDIAGNSSTKTISVTVQAPPIITAQLTQDTAPGGTVNSDKITANPQIQGKVTNATTKFVAGFDNTLVSKYVNILPQLQPDGSFSLSRATLERIFGKTFTEGTHTLHLIATGAQSGESNDDAGEGNSGRSTSFDFTFTLDTLAPKLTLTTPIDVTPLLNNAKLVGTINGTGSNLASINYRWDNSTTLIPITANATGGFDQKLDFTGIPNGTHQITVIATDLAGNISTNSYSVNVNANVNVDTTAPVITAKLAIDTGASNSDKITFTPTVTGTITEASQITGFKASFDGINYVNILAQKQADGTFTLAKAQLETIAGKALIDGNYTLRLIATDAVGNASQNYATAFTLDTTIVVPSNLKLATASDTGTSNSDSITKINTPTITGTGEIGATIKINDGSNVVGQATVGPDGTWQVATSLLTNGTHSLIATATDLAGNISTASAPLNLVVDALLPQLTLTTPLTQTALKNDARLLGNIDGTGSSLVGINYRWDNSTTLIPITPNAIGGFNQGLDFAGIANGSHTLTIVATDVAGNILTTNYNVTVALDKDAPIINLQLAADTGINPSDKITNNPTVTGKVMDVSGISAVTVSLNTNLNSSINIVTSLQPDGTFSLDKATLTQLNGGQLPDGNYQVYLQAVDAYGNTTAPQTLAFQLVSTAIAPTNLQLLASSDTGVSNSDKITKTNQPTIQGNGKAGDTIQLIDGNVVVGTTTVGANGTWQLNSSALTDGSHSLIAKATDIAGNISANSTPVNIQIDSLAPQLTLTQTLDNALLVNNAKLTGTVNGSGSNLTSVSYQWDNSGNQISITPNATGNFDQGLDFTGIPNGSHVLTIAATDTAGNVFTKNYTVNTALDKTAPVITAQLGSDTGASNSDKITFTPTITGTITDASQIAGFKASFDGINYVSILPQKQVDGSFSLDKAQLTTVAGKPLVDGNYTIHLIATDEFGNASQNYDLAFMLDTTITIPGNLKLAVGSDTGASASDNITKINTPTITGTGDVGATIKLTEGTTVLGQTTVGTDGTWQIVSSQLTNGNHSLLATATDIAGNISTASAPLNLVVDALLPQLTLTTPLTQTTLKNDAKLVGNIDGTGSNLTGVNYRWDNSTTPIPITPNATGEFNQGLDFTGIINGSHVLTIAATDTAGNVFTQNYTVNVDVDKTAPIVNLQLAADTGSNTSDKITNNPTVTGKVTDISGLSAVTVSLNPNLTNSVNITTSLQADGTFSFDKAALTQLNGGQLPDGNYQVYLQATDNYGNATTPQTLAFQLLTTAIAPTNLQLLASSDTGASNSDKITKTNQPTIQGNGKTGDTIQLIDGNVLVGTGIVENNGTWQINSSALTDGNHSLIAKAIDLAGNISVNSSGLNLNIDTTPPNLQLSQQLAGIVLTGASHLKGQVTDVNITTISYQFDGANPITLPAGTQFDTPFDFTGINDGGHNLTVAATDIAGNIVSHTYGVTLARGPLLTVALLNDTGISNSDGITSDINVRGQVADRTQISRLEFALDGSSNYTDLTAAMQLDGTFRLLPAQLNSLAGGTLNLGTHSLNVRGVLANGTPIATATLNFTYQSANLNRPSLILAKTSDTGVTGDLVTSATSVDLVAKAASGSSITLGNRTLVADVNGIATFTGVNLILGGNNFTLTTTASNGEIATSNTTITRTNPDDVILTWNHIALAAIQRENTSAPAAARVLGMVHTAMYDAVNAVEQKYGVYRVDTTAPTGADEIAAAAEAAFKVLAAIYPNQQTFFTTALESSLLDGATAAASAAGIALGDTVAANILAWRQQDGSRNPAAFNPTTAVGDWQPDLPNYDGALLPQWGKVTTFGLTSGAQFRPAGDPSLTSTAYTTAFTETKDFGSRESALRTADQTQSVLFWADANGSYTPAGHWNDIAATAASVAGKSLLDNARVFAQLNIALADAGIAAWDAKYNFDAWRPITAIRQADQDGNPLTSADPNWVPLINTPPFPEYVSGHSTFSAAAAAVLNKSFGNNFSFNSGSVTLPNVTRSFTSFDAAAIEAGQSRIYGGIHFQFSNQDGLTLGKQIGDYVTNNLLVDNSLNPIQVSLTKDSAAFGTTNRDRITNQAGITGKVILSQPNLKLQVAQAGGTFVDVTSSLDANGNFQLDTAKLTTIVGTLTDRAYQLTFKLVDPTGQTVSSNNLSFILDTTAAQTTLNPLTGTVTPTVHLTGTATDGNGGSSGRLKVDGGTWTSFGVQPNGNFDKVLNAQGLTVGIHQVDVELADLAGNVTAQAVSFTVDNTNNIYVSPATNPGWGRVFGTGFSLAEGNSLVTQNSINIALGGGGKRTLDFDLATTFDKSDVKSFGKDRVAVYLVDSNNQPISLDSTHLGGVPLFSLSETGSEIIPGLVKFDGTHVQIDVSNVAATNGKLVIQLLNQDGDSGSNLTVTNFVDSIDPNGTRGSSVSPAVTPVTPGAATILDSYMATNSAQLLLSNVSLDKVTGKYTADLRVQNVGTSTLSQNLAVLLTSLPTGVTVANSSGTHPAGSPYLNFNTAIQPGGLSGGAISDAIRVVINDPSLAAFSFKPVVLQGAAAPLPDLSSLATLTVKVGDKIDIPLQGELAIKTATKLPIGKITGDSHLVFTPAPDQVGSYTFTLIARNGGTEVSQNITLNVIADPITTTRVTGVIADTNQGGLAGVLVELSGYQATTDSSGKFTIVLPESSAGDTLKVYGQRIQGGGITYPFIAEKMGLLLGHDIYRGVNNQIDRPIYLPTVDVTTGTTVNPGVSTVVTNPRLVGAQVTVAANSLFDKSGNAFAGIMSITEVPTSLTPAALPENLHPDLVVTIQPGDMVFNTAAKLTLPNKAGYKAGLVMDLWSINPNTGLFDKVGTGKVSADGSKIETISGGILNSSWHFFAPPPPLGLSLNKLDDYNENKVCEVCEAQKSGVSLHSGAVTQDLSLTTYASGGSQQGVSLHYDSLRANPNQIIHVGGSYTTILGTVINPNGLLDGLDVLTTKLTLKVNGFDQTLPGIASGQAGGATGGENLWSLSNGTNQINTSVQTDLSQLATGDYEYKLTAGIQGYRNGQLVGTTDTKTAKLLVVNDSNSVFGSGWNVAGLEKLTINSDNTALLVDGSGSQWFFDAPIGGNFQSPAGDFSSLQQMGDGTYKRTLKNGTVNVFNTQGLMVSSTDTYGNITQHIYSPSGQIQKIIDSVGLATIFTYTGNRVTSMVDPAGRTTAMAYDTQGNLMSVTNPDGTKNQYGYDSHHLLSSSIGKTGQVQTDTYDEFGRAKAVTKEDGTIVQINPVEVQGLLPQQRTTNLNQLPLAPTLSTTATSTYIDGNGQVQRTTLNDRGQIISQTDGISLETSKVYNTNYLVSSEIDAKGHQINYQYDSKGNVVQVSENINTSVVVGSVANSSSRVVEPYNTIASVPGSIYGTFLTHGDVNQDGIDDIISVAKGGLINILLGDPFNPLTTTYTISTLPLSASESINQLEVKDINNDGKLDLIASAITDGNKNGSTLVFINQGAGQFSTPIVLPLSDKPRGFITGDFNGDGKSDILVYYYYNNPTFGSVNNNNPLVLFAGDGQGQFNQQSINIPGVTYDNFNSADGLVRLNSFNFNIGASKGFLTAIDVDGDGRTELILSDQTNGLTIYRYDLSGNWQQSFRKNIFPALPRGGQPLLNVGDLNKDGNLDIVNNSGSSYTILLGQGDGGFSSQNTSIYLPTVVQPKYSQITDFNGDGKPDLFTGLEYAQQGPFGYSISTIFIAYTLDNSQQLNQLGSSTSISAPAGYYNTIKDIVDIYGNGSANIIEQLTQYSNDTNKIGVVRDQFLTIQNVALTKSYTYDSKFNQLTSETDELGHKTLYDLDTNTGKVLKTTRVVGLLDTTSTETDDVVTSYTYTNKGWLDTVTDALLRVTDYDYDNYGHITKTTTAKGTLDQTVEEYEYDLAGNRTATIDALKHKTQYIYNSTNMLLQTIAPSAGFANDSLGGTTTYNYDKMGHQTRVTDALGQATEMTYDSRGQLISTLNAKGETTTDGYDNNGNLIEVRRQKSTDRAEDIVTGYKYDARNRLIGTTAADGGISSTRYDLNNNLTGTTDSLGHSTQKFYDERNRLSREIDALGNQTKYTYNAVNQLIATTDAKKHTTTYQYDELGRQIGTTDALQHSTRTEYDKLGNVTATIDLNGNRTEYTYDALNRRTQVKDAQNKSTYTVYDKVGNILSVTDALNRTTNYGYDDLDRQTTRTDALNQTTTTTYNKVGNVLTITDPIAGHTTSYSYDKLNRKTATTDALNQTQTITYNILGNVSSTTDELGRTTSYEYDKVDRLTTTTDPLLHTTSTSYDTEGNVLTTTDALGQKTSYLYDKNNRRTQVTDAKGGTTKTGYDAVGNVATITDSVNNTTTYGYDALDRLITDTNQLNKTRTRSYDNVGNLTQTTDRNGRKVAYNYDTLNRQTSERWLDSNSATIKTFSASYDAVGHLVSSTNPDSSYAYTYDGIDRVSSIDNTGTVGVPAVKFNYSYDAVGNLIAVNDSINGTSAGITGYSYDLLNRVTKLTQSGTGVQTKRVDMAYNAVNQLTSLSRFSGVNGVVDTSYVYDLNQRLIQLSHKKGASTVASYDYSYDNADKLASTISSVDGTSNYSYDSTNQLTGASHTAQTNEAYSYDANGNRTSGGTVTGVNNQLLSDGTYSYQYDGEGNRTKRTEIATGKVTEYVWDYRNRLASVLFKDAGGIVTKTIDYIYDGNNQRIGKRIDGAVVERYVIDRNQIALVFDGNGVQTHRYLYGTQIDQVLADETATGMVWALADNQGTIRDLIDNSGSVVNHITYDSFGKVVGQSNAGYELRFGYTGREQDSETGLDYYRARYYDASNGRFISEDPIGFEGGDSNLTRYVGNNAVNGIDPSGLEVIAVFSISEKTFTVVDKQTGYQVTAKNVFSGNNMFLGNPNSGHIPNAGAIPLGVYDILHFNPNPNWYRLDIRDSQPLNDLYDDAPPVTGFPRGQFRLHAGRVSLGCVTVPKDSIDDWTKISSIINSTTTSIVQDRIGQGGGYANSLIRYRNRFYKKQNKSSIPVLKYGTLFVTY